MDMLDCGDARAYHGIRCDAHLHKHPMNCSINPHAQKVEKIDQKLFETVTGKPQELGIMASPLLPWSPAQGQQGRCTAQITAAPKAFQCAASSQEVYDTV